MRAPVAAMILALALGAGASSSLTLPYKPEVQPRGATISAAYTIVADRLRVEIATDGRRLERAQVVRPDGALLEAQTLEYTPPVSGGGSPVGIGFGLGSSPTRGARPPTRAPPPPPPPVAGGAEAAHGRRVAGGGLRGGGGARDAGARRARSLGERARRVPAKSRDPVREGRAGRLEEPRGLLLRELPRHPHRREARPVQDLVGGGVAHPAQDAGIGQRSLERVRLAGERGAEGGQIGLEQLEPAGVVLGERGLAPHQMNGGAPLRARRGPGKGAGRAGGRGQ